MTDVAPPPWSAWAGLVAVVSALWAALGRASARELAFVKGELATERTERARERTEAKATLAALGARYDELERRHARYCTQAAAVANAAGEGYRDAMPTDVRAICDDLEKATPTAPRPRLPTIRETYAPKARPR